MNNKELLEVIAAGEAIHNTINEHEGEFIGFMAAHDHGELPDGAWFQMLCDAGDA